MATISSELIACAAACWSGTPDAEFDTERGKTYLQAQAETYYLLAKPSDREEMGHFVANVSDTIRKVAQSNIGLYLQNTPMFVNIPGDTRVDLFA